MTSDPLSSLALTVTSLAATLYALYWVIRRAVAAGIRDASEPPDGAVRESRDDG